MTALVGLRAATLFLTRLPVPAGPSDQRADLGRALGWFPLVGLLLGGVLAGLDAVLRAAVAPGVANALLLIASALLTGALHLDGLADTAAGLTHGGPPAARRAAMRRSLTTPVGASALAGVLVAQYVALGALPGPLRAPALALAPTVGRWAIVLLYAAFPYARSTDGPSATLKESASRPTLALATLAASGTALLLAPGWGMPLLAAAGAAGLALGALARARLGGITGDVCGAACVLAETIVLLTAPGAARFGGVLP